MEKAISHEAEEYIEVIYRLQKQGGAAKTKDISNALHVVPGSVTNTIQHLENLGLVVHEPYRGAKLTYEGEKIAMDILRKHRLAERLLTDVLEADWSNVHEDACKLEHALTKNVVALLEKRLGYPKACPHGNPIPTENGVVEEKNCTPLTTADPSHGYVVESISNEESETLRQLALKCIKPGVQVKIIKHDTQHVCFLVEGKEHRIDHSLAAVVLLRKMEEKKCR
ncbi:MAG: metal-dependent transcriptional regulator [Candidatus Bathyarchaeota archaeon]|nr:metal-dependent transcriptional regulator [Candidatus Bathyarchaeota archaeon]